VHDPCTLSAPLCVTLCRCCKDGQFEQAVGVALESRRLDKLEEVVGRSTNPAATLAYALRVCQALVINRDFRQQVLQLLIRLYEDCSEPDYTVICQCLMFLDDAPGVAKILNKLISSSSGVSTPAASTGGCLRGCLWGDSWAALSSSVHCAVLFLSSQAAVVVRLRCAPACSMLVGHAQQLL
jgi:hypothetical protein